MSDHFFLIPVESPADFPEKFDPSKVKPGDTLQLKEDVHLVMRKIKNKEVKEEGSHKARPEKSKTY